MLKGKLVKISQSYWKFYNRKLNVTNIDWNNIPDEWHDQAITYENDANGGLLTISFGDVTITNPNVKPGNTIEGMAKIKHDLRTEDQSNKSFEKPKPKNILPPNTNQMPPSKAPYNFVPLNDKVVASNNQTTNHSIFDTEKVSGYIDITIETLTHLFIKGKEYDFFKIGTQYGIPGSSLRGMIRNLVEVASFGKFENFNDPTIYERLINAKPLLGFLIYKDNEFFIYEAMSQEVSEVDDRNVEYSYALSPDLSEITVYTKIIGNSRHLKVKYARTNSFRELKGEALEAYKGDRERKAYNRENTDTRDVLAYVKDQQNNIKTKLEENGPDYIGIPVWYKAEGQTVTSFGHCKNYRKRYENAANSAVPEILKNKDFVDFSTSIFGVSTNDKNTPLTAGKVFFEDGKSYTNAITTPAVLQILASPKIKSGKLYLEKLINGEQGRWSHNPKIRGYKLYWHRNTDIYKDKSTDVVNDDTPEQVNWQKTRFGYKNEIQNVNFTRQEKEGFFTKSIPEDMPKHYYSRKLGDFKSTNVKTKIEAASSKLQFKVVNALPPETKFAGARIRIDNLTMEELGALLFVIDLPDGCHHKLGMGKPIGLGSVKLTSTLTIIDRTMRYGSLFDAAGQWNTGEPKNTDKQTYIDAFTTYMNKELAHKSDFWVHPRMATLKTMLTFDHNVKESKKYLEATNYMYLKEFAKKGILPTPDEVIENLK